MTPQTDEQIIHTFANILRDIFVYNSTIVQLNYHPIKWTFIIMGEENALQLSRVACKCNVGGN
jgi:hypothetical protein